MSLLFFPRGLDEIAFEACFCPSESAGHGSLIPTGNTDIQANENPFYDIRAFESAA
jgi:hypothetical protein